MRVIFLDVDGVLNTQDIIHNADRSKHWSETHLDPERIALLDQIVERTGAVCVLSSSWRILVPVDDFEQLLAARGFRGRIIDRTGSCGNRGNEIRDWLLEHPEVERFAVLDDDSQDMEAVKDHLVLTSFERGLEPKHVEEVIKRLEEGSCTSTTK